MKKLTKLDGTVVDMKRGRPKANWKLQPDGNYKEVFIDIRKGEEKPAEEIKA